jgi:hypothetical protein
MEVMPRGVWAAVATSVMTLTARRRDDRHQSHSLCGTQILVPGYKDLKIDPKGVRQHLNDVRRATDDTHLTDANPQVGAHRRKLRESLIGSPGEQVRSQCDCVLA